MNDNVNQKIQDAIELYHLREELEPADDSFEYAWNACICLKNREFDLAFEYAMTAAVVEEHEWGRTGWKAFCQAVLDLCEECQA